MYVNPDDLWKLKWDYLFNYSPESIIILDEDQTILDVNETTLKLLRKEKKDIVGEKCYRIFHNTDNPPEDCPFLEMKKRGERRAINEMNTIVGDFIVEVVPVEIPGEGRRVLHFARDITVVKEVGLKLIESLQRYTSLVSTLINMDSVLLREKNMDMMLKEATRIICENDNFDASWIILKSEEGLKTVSRYGADWNFEDKYEIEEDMCKEEVHTKRIDGGNYLFLTMGIDENFIGLVVLLRNEPYELTSEDVKALKIMADNLSIAIRERHLNLARDLAYKELESNIQNFALLADGIRNPLAVIMGLAEGMVNDDDLKGKIIEQVERIESITQRIDQRWENTERLLKVLKNI
ncbi:PAS domain-containing protein [Aciduliprofundum sp. MAR08-339]|uniref:PAS domain-containing protein n=1 Tax=Aciduliprofundum sp. (strain MAR08-339) TaxID=673860 RepID=UPI00064EADEB